MKGRKPKTTTEHKAQGNYRPSRHADRLKSKPVDEIPAPPDYFDKRHSEKYYEVANLIKGMGVLTATDIDAVVSYTEIFVARETAYKNYLKTKDHKDWIKYRDAFTAQKRLQDDIGFNPRARMSMKVEKLKDDNDPMAELLKNLNN